MFIIKDTTWTEQRQINNGLFNHLYARTGLLRLFNTSSLFVFCKEHLWRGFSQQTNFCKLNAAGDEMKDDAKAGVSDETVWYLRAQQGRRQRVAHVERDRRAGPVTLSKHVEAGHSQGHQRQLPADKHSRRTVDLKHRNTAERLQRRRNGF